MDVRARIENVLESIINITMEINFSSKVYSKRFTKRVTFVVYLSLGSYILSRSMEADILKSKKDIYLVQMYGGRYFGK